MAQAGFIAVDGKGELVEHRGIEVGNIFQLGYNYSKLMQGAVFTDSDGQQKPYYMGCYGIGIGRTMAAIVEKYHDDKGIMWPESVAPFKVHLIALGNKENAEVAAAASKLYEDLQNQGISVLYDDRLEASAGAKFADSDLIGLPVRIVVSARTLAENSVELKMRNSQEAKNIPIDNVGLSI